MQRVLLILTNATMNLQSTLKSVFVCEFVTHKQCLFLQLRLQYRSINQAAGQLESMTIGGINNGRLIIIDGQSQRG